MIVFSEVLDNVIKTRLGRGMRIEGVQAALLETAPLSLSLFHCLSQWSSFIKGQNRFKNEDNLG